MLPDHVYDGRGGGGATPNVRTLERGAIVARLGLRRSVTDITTKARRACTAKKPGGTEARRVRLHLVKVRGDHSTERFRGEEKGMPPPRLDSPSVSLRCKQRGDYSK